MMSAINEPEQAPNGGTTRRISSAMAPPPVPPNSSLPGSPGMSNAIALDQNQTSQGPIRHPRPLTAAELHLELEKEQESIVNRLTRELSALRAQTASVASTASSTSDLFTQPSHNLPDYSGGVSITPLSARRHRSSSNLSARSARSARDGLTATTSVSGVAAPRDPLQTSARQSLDIQRPETSRQNSYNLGLTSSSSTGNMYRSTSNATSPYGPPPGFGGHAHRSSINDSRSPSFGSAQAAARYEEAAAHRAELDAVKKENEALKQKIKDLEKQLSATDPGSST